MTGSMTNVTMIDEVLPDTAFEALSTSEDAALIDVRTSAEWNQIGVPDISATGRPLWFIEWVTGPDRRPNPAFLTELLDHAGGRLPREMYFICRSGARSAAAAQVVAALAAQTGQEVPLHQCRRRVRRLAVSRSQDGVEGQGSAVWWARSRAGQGVRK